MEISDTTPNNNAEGVALETTVDIVFDVEVDPDSIVGSGNLIVATSASKLIEQGPAFENLSATPDDLLASDVFTGFVEGQVATDDNLTVTFTPDSPLQADRLYRVIVSTKVVSRTILDVNADVGNTSTGEFTTRGPYTGAIGDTFTIDVDTGGTLGVATFTYTRASTGMTSVAISTDRVVTLEDGVKLAFTSGTFVADDSWTFVVQEGIPLDDIYEFSFTTGSISHTQVVEDTPSLRIESREIEGINRVDGVPAVDSGTLALVSITPANQASNVPNSMRRIVLTFNKELDPASLDTAAIEVIMENLPFDERQQYSHAIRVTPVVSGNTLTLTFSG